MKNKSVTIKAIFRLVLALALGVSMHAHAEDGAIQDNSFLLEEAYNQEASVVQHISFFQRSLVTRDWVYAFTQELPVTGQKHQFSYTLVGAYADGFPGTGIGDTALNYRYQLLGSGDTRLAVTPRISLLLPTGDSSLARGFGGTGLQTNLAASVVLHPKVITHWNTGATWVPHARNQMGDRAGITGYNLGQSFVWLAHSRFNMTLETVYSDMESVVSPGITSRGKDLLISPGIRWAHNFESGLQIVPGVAVPIGAGPSAGDKGIVFYLSLEHPTRLLGWQKK